MTVQQQRTGRPSGGAADGPRHRRQSGTRTSTPPIAGYCQCPAWLRHRGQEARRSPRSSYPPRRHSSQAQPPIGASLARRARAVTLLRASPQDPAKAAWLSHAPADERTLGVNADTVRGKLVGTRSRLRRTIVIAADEAGPPRRPSSAGGRPHRREAAGDGRAVRHRHGLISLCALERR